MRTERFSKIIVKEDGRQLIIRKGFFDVTFANNQGNHRLAETMLEAIQFKDWMPNGILVREEDGKHHPCKF